MNNFRSIGLFVAGNHWTNELSILDKFSNACLGSLVTEYSCKKLLEVDEVAPNHRIAIAYIELSTPCLGCGSVHRCRAEVVHIQDGRRNTRGVTPTNRRNQ